MRQVDFPFHIAGVDVVDPDLTRIDLRCTRVFVTHTRVEKTYCEKVWRANHANRITNVVIGEVGCNTKRRVVTQKL